MSYKNKIKIIKAKTTGDVVAGSDSQYNNIEADSIIVAENVTVRLFGSVKNMVILKKGSRLFMHGIIYGNVHNEGGELHIFGS